MVEEEASVSQETIAPQPALVTVDVNEFSFEMWPDRPSRAEREGLSIEAQRLLARDGGTTK